MTKHQAKTSYSWTFCASCSEVNLFIAENMTSQNDEDVVMGTRRVYHVLFVDGQVLDFVVEVSFMLLVSDVDCKRTNSLFVGDPYKCLTSNISFFWQHFLAKWDQ